MPLRKMWIMRPFRLQRIDAQSLIPDEQLFETFGPREHGLLALADKLVSARTISRTAWKKHAVLLIPRDAINLITLFLQKTLFALTNNALQVPLATPLADRPGLTEMVENNEPK